MMKKIVCIGNVSYDITMPILDFPVENTKSRVNSRVECGGGPASTAAYLLASWGSDVVFLGTVGNDLYGEKIIEELKSVEMDTNYIKVCDKKTTLSVILANSKGGTRTIITNRDELPLFDKKIDFCIDYILMDGQEYEYSKKLILENKNAITIIDAGRNTKEVIDLCKMVDYVVCSKFFAEAVSGLKINKNDVTTFNKVFNSLEKLFKGKIVITLEAGGSVYKENNEIFLISSLEVTEVLDSTGAGDIYHGAFVYFLANGYDLIDVVKLSNITGALSVRYIGTRNSIPNLNEVLSIYEGL